METPTVEHGGGKRGLLRALMIAGAAASAPLLMAPTESLAAKAACGTGMFNTCCKDLFSACPGVGDGWYDKGCSGPCSTPCGKG